jgi:hypothetical protein
MKNLEHVFSLMETPEPPASLARTILMRIERRERGMLIAKLVVSACAFGVSLVIVGVGLADFRAGMAETGFLQFASLIFSDFSMIVADLPDFALSILESFPAFSAAAMLAGAGFAIWSFATIVDELSVVTHRKFSLPA